MVDGKKIAEAVGLLSRDQLLSINLESFSLKGQSLKGKISEVLVSSNGLKAYCQPETPESWRRRRTFALEPNEMQAGHCRVEDKIQ